MGIVGVLPSLPDPPKALRGIGRGNGAGSAGTAGGDNTEAAKTLARPIAPIIAA